VVITVGTRIVITITYGADGMAFELPRPDQRVLILGSTGSGKTTMGASLLSGAPFDAMPYVMIDYKRDDLLGSIERREQIDFGDIPKHPGLYHLKPNPVVDDEKMEDWLYRVWHRRNIGLYVDEALRLPTKKTGAFESILTQGRSLRIPVVSLSQRPVDLTRYAFSEANHVVVFRLTDIRDRKKVGEYVPIEQDYKLKKYHSMWYNVDSDKTFAMKPSPDKDQILQTFHDRLKPKKKVF
jgi:DNA helicase HerA-like ATPase